MWLIMMQRYSVPATRKSPSAGAPGQRGLGLVTQTWRGLFSGDPLGLRQHDLGLDAGAGVNQVVAEEDLRSGSTGSAVLGHVVGTDVDCGGGGLFDHLDGGNLAVGTAHTVGLAFGCFDDQEDAAVVGRSLIQLEGEGFTPAHDGGRGRVLYTHESGRVGLRSAAAGDSSLSSSLSTMLLSSGLSGPPCGVPSVVG